MRLACTRSSLDPGWERWKPSDKWARWFLHHKMGFVIRAITSSTKSLVLTETQELLWEILLDQLAIDFGDTLKPMIIAHDEFGQHFFPQAKGTWAKQGSKQVYAEIHADSTLVTYLQAIYPGKSKSLPGKRENFIATETSEGRMTEESAATLKMVVIHPLLE